MEKTEITLEYTEERPAFGKAIRPKKIPKKPEKAKKKGLPKSNPFPSFFHSENPAKNTF